MKITEPAPIICVGCGKVFKGKYAYYCPACLKKMKSERAKRINLNKLGNEAYSKQQKRIKCGDQMIGDKNG